MKISQRPAERMAPPVSWSMTNDRNGRFSIAPTDVRLGFIASVKATAPRGNTDLSVAIVRRGVTLAPRLPYGPSFVSWKKT